MEEQILKIIEENRKNIGSTGFMEVSSKEIAETFEKFMEWINKTCEISASVGLWAVYKGGKIVKRLNQKELYAYYLEEINNK